jgi:hypothetical protein
MVRSRPEQQAALLLANLAAVQHELSEGAVVVIEPTRLRIASSGSAAEQRAARVRVVRFAIR